MNDAELNALVARIESLEQQQELLLYAVTHDLRTPVMTILGFADLMLADWQNHSSLQPQSHQHLERIRSAAHRQSQMIQDLQKIAQLQRSSLQPQIADLSNLVQEQLHALINPGSGVIININPASSIRCDVETMKVALNALLSNALKLSASTERPTIDFGLDPQSGPGCFYVRSNGSGFGLDKDQSLLSLFRQLQSRAELAGAGIALLTAAVIIHNHGGKLWVSSQTDSGVTVHFLLPS